MPKASCPSCSVAFEVKPEYSGRRVRCPKCKQPFQVPAAREQDDEDGSASSASMNWLVLGAAVAISLALGGAVGFVFGHRQAMSDDGPELNEAISRAEAALQRQKTLESELASAAAERGREKDRLEATVKEREQQLADAQGVAIQANARAKAAEDKPDARLAKNPREAEEKKPAVPEKKKIPAKPLTEERKRKSEADAEYVDRKLQSTNRTILKGMSMLFGFNAMCEEDNVSKESIASVIGE